MVLTVHIIKERETFKVASLFSFINKSLWWLDSPTVVNGIGAARALKRQERKGPTSLAEAYGVTSVRRRIRTFPVRVNYYFLLSVSFGGGCN